MKRSILLPHFLAKAGYSPFWPSVLNLLMVSEDSASREIITDGSGVSGSLKAATKTAGRSKGGKRCFPASELPVLI